MSKRLDSIKECEKKIEGLQKEVGKLKEMETGDEKKGLLVFRQAIVDNAKYFDALQTHGGRSGKCDGACTGMSCRSADCYLKLADSWLAQL